MTGEALTKNRLSGALTKLAAYRGTSCSVDVADYVVRRINGQKVPAVEQALRGLRAMHEATLGLIRLLTPKAFELLVDLTDRGRLLDGGRTPLRDRSGLSTYRRSNRAAARLEASRRKT